MKINEQTLYEAKPYLCIVFGLATTLLGPKSFPWAGMLIWSGLIIRRMRREYRGRGLSKCN